MQTDTREKRLERCISDLYATDPPFAPARPSDLTALAIQSPELGLPQVVETVLDGYADRPALGQRSVRLVIGSRCVRIVRQLPRAVQRHGQRAAGLRLGGVGV